MTWASAASPTGATAAAAAPSSPSQSPPQPSPPRPRPSLPPSPSPSSPPRLPHLATRLETRRGGRLPSTSTAPPPLARRRHRPGPPLVADFGAPSTNRAGAVRRARRGRRPRPPRRRRRPQRRPKRGAEHLPLGAEPACRAFPPGGKVSVSTPPPPATLSNGAYPRRAAARRDRAACLAAGHAMASEVIAHPGAAPPAAIWPENARPRRQHCPRARPRHPAMFTRLSPTMQRCRGPGAAPPPAPAQAEPENTPPVGGDEVEPIGVRYARGLGAAESPSGQREHPSAIVRASAVHSARSPGSASTVETTFAPWSGGKE